jgi:hypothetical protein
MKLPVQARGRESNQVLSPELLGDPLGDWEQVAVAVHDVSEAASAIGERTQCGNVD